MPAELQNSRGMLEWAFELCRGRAVPPVCAVMTLLCIIIIIILIIIMKTNGGTLTGWVGPVPPEECDVMTLLCIIIIMNTNGGTFTGWEGMSPQRCVCVCVL